MVEEIAVGREDGQPGRSDQAGAAALGDMVPMTVLDSGGVITYASTRWCEMTGWSQAEAVGAHWIQVVHPDDLEEARAWGREAVASGRPIKYDSRVVSRDGSVVTWVQSHVTPLMDQSGRIDRWLLVALDLTGHRQAEEALRDSERRLRVIFDNSADVVTVLEPDGTWRSTTPNARRVLGMSEGDAVSGVVSAVHPDDQARAKEAFADLMDRKEEAFGQLYEVRIQLVDGTTRWVETTGVNLVDEPAVGGIVLHSRDVTARHLAEEELLSASTRLAALIGNMHLGVRISNENGVTIAVNGAFVSILSLECTTEDLLGEDAPGTLARFAGVWGDPEADVERLVGIVASRTLVAEARFDMSNGRTVGASFIPIDVDGTYRGNMWLIRDITEEMAVAAEREYLLEIEKQQNVRLTELDTLKTDLVASVSHELRTPLTSIVSFTQLLRDGVGVDSFEEQIEFLDIVGRNTERLLRLVDDLLLLDRLESNAVRTTIEPVDLASLVDQAASSIRPLADENGIELQVRTEQGPMVRGDVDRLDQLIGNLLANAIKFTPAGGRVSIGVHPTAGAWTLEVADTGIGIPADEQGQLFQRFFRASNARQQWIAGSGLGLAIVRRVAEFHQGQVYVHSVEGVGTIIIVTLRGAIDASIPMSPLAQAPSKGAVQSRSVEGAR